MKISLVPNREHLARMREIGGPVLRQTFSMDDPALLRALGATHRAQEMTIFSSEGVTGGKGKWATLNPRYAAHKAKVVGRKKILNLTGDTKEQFTVFGAPGYFQQYIPRGATGIFRFGAKSDVAAAHFFGNPNLANGQSATARKVFGGKAPRLPVRDMVTKSAAQLAEMRETLRTWFIGKVKQQLRAGARLGGHR